MCLSFLVLIQATSYSRPILQTSRSGVSRKLRPSPLASLAPQSLVSALLKRTPSTQFSSSSPFSLPPYRPRKPWFNKPIGERDLPALLADQGVPRARLWGEETWSLAPSPELIECNLTLARATGAVYDGWKRDWCRASGKWAGV